ncbi:hypothetical protein HS088_TW09G00400 [Tripterygium wilfordii]|uniref:Uncharacterized protein n=1 Tax=Tripterygium wilfordii TaxID=458696 RepID=A0A7J7D7K6_TRIWF|nr:hypothetical protein HS088_TW09G00400 [Tripterygium wilfordii]
MMEDGETINLNPKEEKSVANLTGQVHQLPCCIKYDGPCCVSDYFKPKSTGSFPMFKSLSIFIFFVIPDVIIMALSMYENFEFSDFFFFFGSVTVHVGMEVEGLQVGEAYFRGRKLQGATIPLPHGYSGFVIERGLGSHGKRKASDMSVEDPKCWHVNAKFENITYWNHDSLPSENDSFLRAFHWFAVAEALHKPITTEDLASATLALEKLD